MIGQVRPAVDAAVGAVAGRQVSLERLRLGHLHHVSGAGLLAGVRAGTGRVAALLDLLTEETLEDASKSRRCCGVGVWHAPHRHHRRKSNLRGKGNESCGERYVPCSPIFRIKCITNINTVHLLKQSFDYNHLLCDYNRMLSTLLHIITSLANPCLYEDTQHASLGPKHEATPYLFCPSG